MTPVTPTNLALYNYYITIGQDKFWIILYNYSSAFIAECRASNLIDGCGIIDLLPHHPGKAGHLVRVLPHLGRSKRYATLQLRSSDLIGVIPRGCQMQFTFKGRNREATTVSDVVHFKKVPDTDFIQLQFKRPKLESGITDEHGSYRCVLMDAEWNVIYTFEGLPGSLVLGRDILCPKMRVIQYLNSQDDSIYMDIWDNLLGVLPGGFLKELQRVYEENGPYTNENLTERIERYKPLKRKQAEKMTQGQQKIKPSSKRQRAQELLTKRGGLRLDSSSRRVSPSFTSAPSSASIQPDFKTYSSLLPNLAQCKPLDDLAVVNGPGYKQHHKSHVMELHQLHLPDAETMDAENHILRETDVLFETMQDTQVVHSYPFTFESLDDVPLEDLLLLDF
ncbi:hypothetical protein PROFUN_06565 [Planoprotostelium fungivorum]|uniref:Uncharacterized protein n=1 Tax=Planoprotostelium fungivorum TaxID=1890364 RepID=A0A2P6MRY4_9EUKA|nr:hypothetical protein PROFUN_06565 [Planoprotostelium fungivorum]